MTVRGRRDAAGVETVRSRVMSELLSVDGIRIEVRRIPSAVPEVMPVVFLHEGLGSVSHWRTFPDELCAVLQRPGLVYSRQGYGQSDPIRLPRRLDYLSHEGAEVLPRVLDAAGVDRAILFGHSDGGSIALAAAASVPRRIPTLILESAHVFSEPAGLHAIQEAATSYEATDLRARLARHHADVDGAFWGWADAWLHPDFLHPDLTGLLGAVTAPALLIQGTADPYGTLAQSEAIAAGLGAVVTHRLDLPGVGHSPHRECPELVMDATERFLASLPHAPAGSDGASAH